MNREEYMKLRFLPENEKLTEYDFQMKYDNIGRAYKYSESNIIKDIDKFKDVISKIKQKTDKRTIEC